MNKLKYKNNMGTHVKHKFHKIQSAHISKTFLVCLLMLALFSNITYAGTEMISVSFINQNPDPARAGEIVEIRFKVENLGDGIVDDLELELLPEYPFTKISGEEYLNKIDPLSPYQAGDNALIVKFKVKVDNDAIEGTNKINLKQNKAGSLYTTKIVNIEIVSREFAEIIYIDKSKIMPGKETEMIFTIHNTGSAPLQNMVFTWSEENDVILPVGTDNSRYIKYLNPGDNIQLKYTVIGSVNANPDLYKLDLNLEYEVKDENGVTSKETVSTKAGVFVGGETDFEVTFSESSAGQTSLSVANTGNNPALSVTVRVPEQENYAVSGSTSSIIGNLDKGDYTIVSFQISQKAGLGRMGTERPSAEEMKRLREQASQRNFSTSNNLKVLLEYTDTTGARQTLEKNVPIQFRTLTGEEGQAMRPGQFRRPSQQTSIWTYIIIVLVVTGVGIIYYKKRVFINKKVKEIYEKVFKKSRKRK